MPLRMAILAFTIPVETIATPYYEVVSFYLYYKPSRLFLQAGKISREKLAGNALLSN